MTTWLPNGPFAHIGPHYAPPAPKRPEISYRCHLGTVNPEPPNHPHHKGCDGLSYGPSLTTKGTPCACPCHIGQQVPKPVTVRLYQ